MFISEALHMHCRQDRVFRHLPASCAMGIQSKTSDFPAIELYDNQLLGHIG